MDLIVYGFIGYFLFQHFAVKCNAEALLQQWLSAVSSRRVKAVMSLYAPNALLLPTFGKAKRGYELEEYFRRFLAKQNLKGKILSLDATSDGKLCVASGQYEFTYTENGKHQKVPARFTFVYQFKNGRWKIIQHQSSVEPK